MMCEKWYFDQRVSRPAPGNTHYFPIVLILLLCAGFPLFAQSPDTILSQTSFTPQEKEAISAVFRRAQDDALPTVLLENRLREGIAKHVSPAAVVQVLTRDAGLLKEAREILKVSPTGRQVLNDTASWARAANLLGGGQSAKEVGFLVEQVKGNPQAFRPAGALYAALRDWGLSVSEAQLLVSAVTASPLPPEEYEQIPAVLISGQRQRIQVDEMIRRMEVALPRAKSVAALRRQVLNP